MKVHGFSTALYSTWILVEDLGLLLDAGDGVTSGLLSKSRKARTIAISHADRDHVSGLFQLNQLNAGHTIERLLFPADSGSFPAIRDFVAEFDSYTANTFPWLPARPGDRIPIGPNLLIEAVSNTHIDSPLVKSLGYRAYRTKRKLKPEYASLDSREVESLARQLGKEATTVEVEELILAYAGDTGVETPEKWQGCQTLIHEATFLDHEDMAGTRTRNLHSCLEEVLAMARDAAPERLLLHHFSSRYAPEDVRKEIHRIAAELRLGFPVFAIMPGDIARDIFGGSPIFEPG